MNCDIEIAKRIVESAGYRVLDESIQIKKGTTFENAGKTWEILDIKGDYVLIYAAQKKYHPYVVAWHLDPEDGTWAQGHYFMDEKEARDYMKENIDESINEDVDEDYYDDYAEYDNDDYKIESDYPETLLYYLDKGIITLDDLKYEMERWYILESSNVHIYVFDKYVQVEGLTREQYQELNSILYDALEEYGRELDEEYQDDLDDEEDDQ